MLLNAATSGRRAARAAVSAPSASSRSSSSSSSATGDTGTGTNVGPGTGNAWTRFSRWRRRRPFLGGVLIALGGVELFFSGQLDIGKIHVQLGIEGLQATIIPIVLVLLGVLVVSMPAHRIFYGVIALVLAVYSLVGVNLGGFFVGMLLSTVGGVLTVAWMPKTIAAAATTAASDAPDERTSS